MARLSKDVIVVSKPVRTFPNGDYFYIELCRKNSRYECVVHMNCSRNPGSHFVGRGPGRRPESRGGRLAGQRGGSN